MEIVIAVAILAAIVAGWFAINGMLSRRVLAKHDGDVDAAAADSSEPIPSAHLIGDDRTPAGDTPEAHDEINPHDVPLAHPGRRAAEREAAGDTGTTPGDRDPSEDPAGAADADETTAAGGAGHAD